MNLLEMQEFFNRAMKVGWGTNPEKGTIIELPGSKTITYQEGGYKLMDCWFTNPFGDHSWGFLLMWKHTGETWHPVWKMVFVGCYKECAIPVVKSALRETAKQGTFYGGRGGPVHTMNGRRYTNVVISNDFHSFRGREQVTNNQNGTLEGYHDYSGGVMFDID